MGKLVATGVQLGDGSQIIARKEVILAAGAHRSPQILMLSGIGAESELSKVSIPLQANLPHVGHNSIDHFALFQFWKLRNPSHGFTMGKPPWSSPAYFKGLPCDWAIKEAVPTHILSTALRIDIVSDADNDANAAALIHPSRCHLETMILYVPAGAEHVGLQLPNDGMHVASSLMLLLPTSRGRVSLASASATDPPVIDPNHYATATDRAALIYGTQRLAHALLNTAAGKAIIEREVAPPGLSPLDSSSTGEEIDARVRSVGVAHAHTMGTAAMGKVVGVDLSKAFNGVNSVI